MTYVTKKITFCKEIWCLSFSTVSVYFPSKILCPHLSKNTMLNVADVPPNYIYPLKNCISVLYE